MSIAEKLKALIAHENDTLGYDGRSVLHAALPQIVAVVAAVEGKDCPLCRQSFDGEHELDCPLAALDEALGDVT